MRDYDFIETTKKQQVETEIGCNKCGKTQPLTGDEYEKEYQKEGYSDISLSFGYGSSYDCQHWSFDLCEECLTDLIKTFKHVPAGFGEDSYSAYYPQVMFEEWKQTGVVNLEAGTTAEEIEANGGSIYTEEEEK